MQDAGGGWDWMHAASAMGGAVFGALSAIAAWIYKAGGQEPTIRADFQKGLADTERKIETKVDDMLDHFQESFNGIRRQIDDNRLHTETNFLRKDDFKEWRDEYREDMRDLKQAIADAKLKPS